MVTYRTVEENLHHPEIGHYTSFGIAAYHKRNKEESLIAFISDVFLEKEKAENLVCLCNEYKLDIIHLHDIVEDAIGKWLYPDIFTVNHLKKIIA